MNETTTFEEGLTPFIDANEVDGSDFSDEGYGPSGYVRIAAARRLERRCHAAEALLAAAKQAHSDLFSVVLRAEPELSKAANAAMHKLALNIAEAETL